MSEAVTNDVRSQPTAVYTAANQIAHIAIWVRDNGVALTPESVPGPFDHGEPGIANHP